MTVTHQQLSKALPTSDAWSSALRQEVQDAEGKPHAFGDLVGKEAKVLVIFVRHWWCSVCQAYIRHLSRSYPSASATNPNPPRVIVIGCGDYIPIKNYIESTSSTFPIYANPSLSLYDLLGFKSALKMNALSDPSKEYSKDEGVMSMLWRAWKDGPAKNLGHVGKTGPITKNGGELIIENGQPTMIHRMADTSDHTDIPDLLNILGLDKASSAAQVEENGENWKDVKCEVGTKA